MLSRDADGGADERPHKHNPHVSAIITSHFHYCQLSPDLDCKHGTKLPQDSLTPSSFIVIGLDYSIDLSHTECMPHGSV